MKERKFVKLFLGMCCALFIGAGAIGCTEKETGDSMLSGTWEAEGKVAAYQFSEDGTGYAYVKTNPDITVDFTYTIENDTVTIEKVGSDTQTQFTMKEENGETVLYNNNKHGEKVVKVSE
ncbi:MAG: DUF5640 domain-containing protein [Clostridiales bacterium]|nr:DUF5640 domain-containing protein [Clostridiales bacterium]